MSEGKITTESVAAGVVETEPIVLRESETRRLVFKAMIIDREEAPVRGTFVWQRKKAADDWEEITGETLTSLKAGEGFSLELKSAEVATLLQGIADRAEIYAQLGISFGSRDFYAGTDLPEVIKRIVDEPGTELAAALQTLDASDLLTLGRSVDVSKLDALLEEWDANERNNDEGFWQDLLMRNSWVFSQLTGSPVVLLQERAYVGGKGLDNTGGKLLDYLVKNALTENVSLIEIKTPGADLCAREYRGDAHPPGREVAGGIVQVLSYRDTFLAEMRNLIDGSATSFRAYNPHCYLIVGTAAALSEGEKRSFELFRNAQSGVHVLTFDEVRLRLQGIRDVLTADDQDHEAQADEVTASDGIVDASELGWLEPPPSAPPT